MPETFIFLIVVGIALVAIARGWSVARAHRIARERLDVDKESELPEEPVEEGPPTVRPFLTRYRWIPWVAIGITYLLIDFGAGLKTSYAIMFGILVGLLAHEVEGFLAQRQGLLIEAQLADAIDLMVASLRAGASVLNSFESAMNETRSPLKPQLQEVLGRVRYGEDPASVFQALAARVPLETFRLFSSALTVHQEVGGSLAPTLATVGRIIRDRIELGRRVRSLTVQSRASTFAIMFVTYFIGLLMWRTDRGRMEEFLATELGSFMVSGAVMMQAIGIFWTSWWSRLKY